MIRLRILRSVPTAPGLAPGAVLDLPEAEAFDLVWRGLAQRLDPLAEIPVEPLAEVAATPMQKEQAARGKAKR